MAKTKKKKSTSAIDVSAAPAAEPVAPAAPAAEPAPSVYKKLCPSCGIDVPQHRCPQCRATFEIQPVNGMVIWMRNGRVVRAFKNPKAAYVETANKYGIPTS